MHAYIQKYAAPALWALAACAMGFASATVIDVRAPAQWTQFRLRGDNNAVIPGSLAATWKISTSGGFSSSPTIADGMLYIGNNAGQLLAIDPATGAIRWTYRVKNPIMSAPLVYSNVIIAGEGNENSPDGSSPAHPIRVGDPPNALIGVNRLTGAPVWRVDLRGSGMPTPAIVDGILVHHNGSGDLLGVNPQTGSVLYLRDLRSIASMTAATPVGHGLFVTAGMAPTAIWMLRAKDGSAVWESQFSPVASGLGDCPPASDGARIYCTYVMPPSPAIPVQTERMATLRAYAVDLKTGKKAWDIALENGELPKRNEAAIPLIAGGTLFVGSSVAPVMHAVDPRTGNIKWRVTTHGPIKGGIVDVDGVLYFGDLGGYLWALRASDGAVVGVKNMHTPFNVGSPVVAGATLIIGSRGGTLMAIPLSDIRASRDT